MRAIRPVPLRTKRWQDGTVQFSADRAGLQDMRQIPRQPVAQIHRAAGDAPQRDAERDARGGALQPLAQGGEITLRMHPQPMLDASSTPAGYSGRAANAAVCAYAEDEDPAQWAAAESALFTDQPDAAGLSDAELSTRISQATGLDVDECITEGTYLPWLREVVEPAAQATGQGTPAVFIDDEQFTGDITAPGSLEEAIAAA